MSIHGSEPGVQSGLGLRRLDSLPSNIPRTSGGLIPRNQGGFLTSRLRAETEVFGERYNLPKLNKLNKKAVSITPSLPTVN